MTDIVFFDGCFTIEVENDNEYPQWVTGLVSQLRKDLHHFLDESENPDELSTCLLTRVGDGTRAIEIYYDNLYCDKEMHNGCFCVNNIANFCPDRLQSDLLDSISAFNKIAPYAHKFVISETRNVM